jgi:hypothetical protein
MSTRERILYEGLIAGLIGYVIIVLFFAAWNLLQGHSPFYTAALLGDALFYAGDDGTRFAVEPGPVLAFNGVHMLLLISFGVAAAWLAALAERGTQLWYVGAIAFVFILIHLIGGMVWMSAPLRAEIPAWAVGVSTLLAAGALTAYLWWAHPRLHHGQAEDAGD